MVLPPISSAQKMINHSLLSGENKCDKKKFDIQIFIDAFGAFSNAPDTVGTKDGIAGCCIHHKMQRIPARNSVLKVGKDLSA